MLRVFFEAHADFMNVCGDPDYHKRQLYKSDYEAVKFYKAARDDVMALPGRADTVKNIEGMLAKAEAEIVELEAFKPTREQRAVTYKFRTPFAEPNSLTIYSLLCSPGHNDTRSIIERFKRGNKLHIGELLHDPEFFDYLWLATWLVGRLGVSVEKYADPDAAALAKFEEVAGRAAAMLTEARRGHQRPWID
jgi:hypothetical protein